MDTSSLPRREFANDGDRKLAETLCNLQIPATIRLSPDGKRIVYSTSLIDNIAAEKHPKTTLWLAETGKKDSSRQLTHGLFNDVCPRWSPNGSFIAFLSDRGKEGEASALYALPMIGEAYPITDAEFESDIQDFEISPDGKRILFLSEDEKSEERKKKEEEDADGPTVWNERWDFTRLRIVNVSDKTAISLTEGLDRNVYEATWSPDGKSIAFVHTNNPEEDEEYLSGSTLSIISIDTKEITDITTITTHIQDLIWGGDGLLYFSSHAPLNRSCGGQAVYQLDAETRNVAKVAYGVDSCCEGLLKRSGEIIVKVAKGIVTELRYLSSGKALFSQPTNFNTWDVHLGEEVILALPLSDPSHPAEVSTIQGDSEPIKYTNLGAPVADYRFGAWKLLTCKSKDKEVSLDGIFISSANSPTLGPQPTFVMIHGGPTGRDCPEFEAYYYHWASYILGKGYSVLLPQYRGSSGRGEKFAMYSFGGIGKYDHADVLSITDYAIKSGHVDPKKVIVGGWSQGGFLTYLCCTRNGLQGLGWKFKAGIAGAGISDVDATVLADDLGLFSDPELMGGKAPWNMDQFDASNRSASALWEVKAAMDKSKETGETVIPPMLLLHGESDDRCPPSQALGFHRALRYHKLQHDFVLYPRQGHGFTEQRFWIDMLMRIGNWCDKYIGPDSSTEKSLPIR